MTKRETMYRQPPHAFWRCPQCSKELTEAQRLQFRFCCSSCNNWIHNYPIEAGDGYRFLDKLETIHKDDEVFDCYSGWMKHDGYYTGRGMHLPEGRWLAFRRKI